MPREAEIERFRAKTDTGKEYVIVMYQQFIDVSSHDFPRAEIPGLKRLITSDGLTVRYIDPTTFKIDLTGETVRKV